MHAKPGRLTGLPSNEARVERGAACRREHYLDPVVVLASAASASLQLHNALDMTV